MTNNNDCCQWMMNSIFGANLHFHQAETNRSNALFIWYHSSLEGGISDKKELTGCWLFSCRVASLDPVYTRTDPNRYGSNLDPCPYLLAFTLERIRFRSRLHWNGSTTRSSPVFSALTRILLQSKAKFSSLSIRTRLGKVLTIYTRRKRARIQMSTP